MMNCYSDENTLQFVLLVYDIIFLSNLVETFKQHNENLKYLRVEQKNVLP